MSHIHPPELADSMLDFLYDFIRITADRTLTISDPPVILCNPPESGLVLTLPASSQAEGVILYIKNQTTSDDDVTIDANGSELIDSELTSVISGEEALTIFCDGTQWRIM